MGTPSVHTMPEHWTELNASRRQKKLCYEQVEALKNTCKQECGKENIKDCPQCYGKLIDRVRARYSEGEEREWFTQRRAFLHELDGLFQDAKDGKRSLKSIEARIESEKEAWYRWVLRRYPEFIAVSDHGISQDKLRGMLDDPDISREELVNKMLEGIGKQPGWASGLDVFADKVAAAKGDAAELKKLYIAEFFIDQSTGQVLENAQKYLDEYQSSEGMSLEDIIDRIVYDFQQSRSAQPLRVAHQRRLDELQRAKTAFEQNKMQAKSLKESQNIAVSPALYDLTPCALCSKAVSPNDVLSCMLCQAMVQIGGDAKLTVYCSEECFTKGHDKHIDSQHDCEAGDQCVQLSDEDVEMDMGDGISRAVGCTDCLDLKKATLYCSERCAVANIAGHRQTAHGANTESEQAHSLVAPLQPFLESTLKSRNPGLEMRQVS